MSPCWSISENRKIYNVYIYSELYCVYRNKYHISMNYPFGMTQADNVKTCKHMFPPFFPLGSTWPKDPTHLTSLPGSVRVGIRAALVPRLFGDGHFASSLRRSKKMFMYIYIFCIYTNTWKYHETSQHFLNLCFQHITIFAVHLMVLPVHRWLHGSFRVFRFQTMAPKGATYFIILGIPSINCGPLCYQ